MLDTFDSFPQITLKRLFTGDPLSIHVDKIQHNFDQIYLHTINKILQGEQGVMGYTGLSIIGEQGDIGNQGSIIYVDDTIVDGQLVTNPLHRDEDFIVNGIGQYFEIINNGTALEYSLLYSPTSTSIFTDQTTFAGLGTITNHKLRFFDAPSTDSNIVLASRISGDAEYYRLILGSNVYNGIDLDTSTFVNILGEATGGGSVIADALAVDAKKFSQIKLRYRNSSTSASSLSSFDMAYHVQGLDEWSILRNNQAEVVIKNNSGTGISEQIINTTIFAFTGGITDSKTSDVTNSLIVDRMLLSAIETFRIKQPAGYNIEIGDLREITVKAGKIGINNTMPTVEFHSMGAAILEYKNGGTGVTDSKVEITSTNVEIDAADSWLNVIPLGISANAGASGDITLKLLTIGANMKWNDRSLILASSSTKLSYDVTRYLELGVATTLTQTTNSVTTFGDESVTIYSRNAGGGNSNLYEFQYDAFYADTFKTRNTHLNIAGLDTAGTQSNIWIIGGGNSAGTGGKVNIRGGESTAGNGGDLVLGGGIGTAGDGSVKLEKNVKAVDPNIQVYQIYNVPSSSSRHATDFVGGVQFDSFDLPATETDRMVYWSHQTGGSPATGVQYSILVENGVGSGNFIIIATGFGKITLSAIIPAQCKFRIFSDNQTVGASTARLSIQKFGL